MIRNALTIDVEDYFHVSAFSDSISSSNWDKYESRVENNTMRLLDLFKKNNIKATFFVLGWVARKHPSLVKEIAINGHEVACHGYSHQLIYKQSYDEFYNETVNSKKIIEDIVGQPVLGYRAASYSITKQSLWALDILAELGFMYDSSIVPVHHDLYGIPGMPRNPHVITSPHGHKLIEFPPTTFRLSGVNLPVAGGGYFRLYPYWLTREALKWVNQYDRMPFIFYLHPWEIDADQPRIQAKWFSKFRHYNNLKKCLPRLERLLNDFKFTTAADVLLNLNESSISEYMQGKLAVVEEFIKVRAD